MALDNLGLSFLPGAANENGQDIAPTSQLEDVIKILSFRLPRVVGARAIAPDALLNSPGGAGDPLGDSIARQILQNIVRQQPSGMAPGGPMGGGAGTSPFDDLLRRSIPGGSTSGSASNEPGMPMPLPTPFPQSPPPRIIPTEPGMDAPMSPSIPAPRPRKDRERDYYPGMPV